MGRLSRKIDDFRGTAPGRSKSAHPKAESRSLIGSSVHHVWVFDADRKVQIASQPTSLKPGDAADERLHVEDRAKFWEAVEACRGKSDPVAAKFRDKEGRYFSGSVVDLTCSPSVCGILVDACDVTEEIHSIMEHRRLSRRDPLTGLMTREAFLEEILTRSGAGPLGLLLFDVDGFKVINNSLGHSTGDYLLMVIAKRLQECLRQGDVASRPSGDEFSVLVSPLKEAELYNLGKRIQCALQQPVELDGRTIIPSLSLGVVYSDGDEEPETVLRNADLALMRGRDLGRGHITVFEPAMNAAVLERLELEAELRGAIEKREFELHYQPIVDLDTLEVKQLEALIRWNSPTRGQVSPMKFIPIAEETGLIVEIGAWVLQEGMMQAQEWRLRHGLEHLTINLNLSTRQLMSDDLLNQAREALLCSEIPAEYVKLEITESVMMENLEENLAKLRALRDMGFQIAVDDFGVGYSSLAYLSRLPLSTLKVDRSFVDRMGQSEPDDAIVRSIVSLARTLKLTVTCEGVETGYQLERLQELQCDHGQGYFFYKPLPAKHIEAILEEDAIMRRAA